MSTQTVREAIAYVRRVRERRPDGIADPYGITVQLAGLEAMFDLLADLEWSGYADCAGTGYMGSGPPMHPKGHPACPQCGGLRPEQPYDRCFREEAKGHRKGCRIAAVLETA